MPKPFITPAAAASLSGGGMPGGAGPGAPPALPAPPSLPKPPMPGGGMVGPPKGVGMGAVGLPPPPVPINGSSNALAMKARGMPTPMGPPGIAPMRPALNNAGQSGSVAAKFKPRNAPPSAGPGSLPPPPRHPDEAGRSPTFKTVLPPPGQQRSPETGQVGLRPVQPPKGKFLACTTNNRQQQGKAARQEAPGHYAMPIGSQPGNYVSQKRESAFQAKASGNTNFEFGQEGGPSQADSIPKGSSIRPRKAPRLPPPAMAPRTDASGNQLTLAQQQSVAEAEDQRQRDREESDRKLVKAPKTCCHFFCFSCLALAPTVLLFGIFFGLANPSYVDPQGQAKSSGKAKRQGNARNGGDADPSASGSGSATGSGSETADSAAGSGTETAPGLLAFDSIAMPSYRQQAVPSSQHYKVRLGGNRGLW